MGVRRVKTINKSDFEEAAEIIGGFVHDTLHDYLIDDMANREQKGMPFVQFADLCLIIDVFTEIFNSLVNDYNSKLTEHK